ncbi:hypothetical protein VPHD148_0168 [Vibrio phage D148]
MSFSFTLLNSRSRISAFRCQSIYQWIPPLYDYSD